MPELNIVQFKQGLKSNYLSIETKDPNTLYFCTDTQEFFLGSAQYSLQLASSISDSSNGQAADAGMLYDIFEEQVLE